MKFLLFILVIIDNLNVVLANNDYCGLNDLNALMVRLRQLRTDMETQHDATQAEIKVLKEANGKQETELENLRQEINNKSTEIKLIKDENRKQETELEELRQDVNNKSLEIAAISKDIEKIKAAIWYFFQGSYYYTSTKSLNWSQSEKDCIALGGHLVEITSEQENNFIKSLMASSYVWIGLNDRVTENVYVWVSSENIASGVYTNWAPDQPNNLDGNQDCVEMFTSGKWNDWYCSEARHYICEKASMLA